MISHTRRDFTKLALAALPAAGFFSAGSWLQAAAAGAKPNSKVAGVQIGLNVPYSFGDKVMNGEEVLKNCVALGLSGVELRTQPVELYMGLPPELMPSKKAAADKGAKTADKTAAKAADKSAGGSNEAKIREWRKSAPMDRAKAFRAMYEEAGVLIEIVKVDGIFKMSDEELDYAFTLAKTLGGRAISSEISHTVDELKRVGQFADKHQMLVGYHGHATTKPEDWEAGFAVAKYNGANVDLGHFVAGNNVSPAEFIKKYHERVTHVHVKDRKFNNGPNTPFGEGDTPIAEVLRLIRDNKWNIQATIEFEYKIPEGSDRMKELARAIQFTRDALSS